MLTVCVRLMSLMLLPCVTLLCPVPSVVLSVACQCVKGCYASQWA